MIIEEEGGQSPIITRSDKEKWDTEKDEPSSDTPRSIKRSILEHFQTDLKRAELDKQLKTTTDIFKELPASHITKKALLQKVGPPPSSPMVPAHAPVSIPFDLPSPISTGESPKESSRNQAMPSPIRRLHSKVSRIGSKAGSATPLHKSAILRQKEITAELEDVLHLWEALIDSTECPQESELLQYLRRLDPNKLLMFGSTADDLRTFHSQLLQSIKTTKRDDAKRKNTITRLHSFFQRRQRPLTSESQKKETNVRKFLDIFNDYELSDEEPTPDIEMVKLEREAMENIGDNLIDFEQLVFHQKIGEGAYSEVFAGTYNQHQVAIKRFKDFNGHKTQLIHFAREVSVLKQVENVARITNMRGACLFPVSCILFEYFECGSLEQFSHQHHFDFVESVRLALSVAETIQNLHSLDPPLIHRDISMSNILLKKNQTGLWTPYLSDFGISQVLQGDVEGTSTGHPRYRPPEITLKITSLQGTGVDVYCFGSFLYELFVGEKVGHPMSDAEVCELRIRGENVPLPVFLEAGVADLISACWAFDPAKRPNFSFIIQKLKMLGQVV